MRPRRFSFNHRKRDIETVKEREREEWNNGKIRAKWANIRLATEYNRLRWRKGK